MVFFFSFTSHFFFHLVIQQKKCILHGFLIEQTYQRKSPSFPKASSRFQFKLGVHSQKIFSQYAGSYQTFWTTNFFVNEVSCCLEMSSWIRRGIRNTHFDRQLSELVNEKLARDKFLLTQSPPMSSGSKISFALSSSLSFAICVSYDLGWPRMTSFNIYLSSVTSFLLNELYFEALASICKNA